MSVAVEMGSKNVVEMLIKECGIDVNAKVDRHTRQSAIFCAIRHEQLEIVEFLLKLGANIEDRYLKFTPLNYAASNGQEDIVETLIKHGANLNCGLKFGKASGEPPLIEAVYGGNATLIKRFLGLGCSAEILKTALNRACCRGHADIVNLILDHPTSIDARIIDSAVLLSPTVVKKTEIVELLIQRGADINARGPENETALLVAAKWGYANIVRLLLHHGANINDVDSKERGALFNAASGNNQDVVVCLLKRGIDVDQKDKKGCTPLFEAVKKMLQEVVELLLNNNADFNVENKFGKCIMDRVIAHIKNDDMEFAKFMVMRMVQMRYSNLFVSEKNWLASKRNEELAKFQCDFEKEMKGMKISSFTDLGISFYDIIRAPSDVKFLDLATNEKVKSLLESDEFKSCYPICQEVISCRFKITIKEREFMDQVEYFFLSLAERNDNKLPKLARVCVYKIASYLKDNDKKNVSSIFTV